MKSDHNEPDKALKKRSHIQLTSPQKKDKDSHQKLLNKGNDTHRPLREPLPLQMPPNRKTIKITHDLDYRGQGQKQAQFCFPKFLTDLGRCFTSCRILCPCCFCGCCLCKTGPLFRQQMTSVGLLEEWGRFKQVLEPGLHVINPISESVVQINQQTQTLEYTQICISKDNVQFQVVVVVFYRFVDFLRAAYRLGGINAQQCVVQIACGTLRSIAGENLLQEIIGNRNLISYRFTTQLNQMLHQWGIFVQISCLKQIQISQDIKQALQMVAQTKRSSEAILISYRAQVSCAALYKQISQIVNTKAAFQIRYLNMIEGIIEQNQDNTLFIKTQLESTKGDKGVSRGQEGRPLLGQ